MNGTESLVRRRCIIVLRRICQTKCTSIVIYIFTSPIVIVAPLTMRASHFDATREPIAGGSNAPNPTRSHLAKTPTRYFSHTCFLARALCIS